MKLTLSLSFLMASLAAPAVAGPEGAPVQSVNSSVRAEVKDSLPGATPKSTAPIHYPPPAEINVSAMQWCGDSDVDHYAKANPAWKNMLATQMPFVLGYWVAPANDPDGYVPTPTNYFALGTGIVPVGGEYINEFVPASQKYEGDSDKGKKRAMYPLALKALRNLTSAKSFSMKAGSENKYRLFLGVMMCHDGGDINKIPVKGQGTYGIAPAELTANLAGSIYNDITSNADLTKNKDWSKIERNMRFGLELKGGNDASTGGLRFVKDDNDVPLRGPLADLAEKVKDFDFDFSKTYPGGLEKELYDELMKKSFAKPLSQLATSLEKTAKCGDVNKTVDGLDRWEPEKFAWEPYPLQLTCRALDNGTAGSFAKAVDDFLKPASPKKDDFERRRAEVIRLLVQGAQMQNAQLYVHNKINGDNPGAWKLPKQRCFDDNHPMINYMMQSLVIQVPESPAADYRSAHPEPDYAIGGYDKYGHPKYKSENTDEKYTTGGFDKMGGDEYAVFGMSGVNPLESSVELLQGNSTDNMATKYMPGTMRLNLNVRGVGSCVPQYCWNAKSTNATAKRI